MGVFNYLWSFMCKRVFDKVDYDKSGSIEPLEVEVRWGARITQVHSLGSHKQAHTRCGCPATPACQESSKAAPRGRAAVTCLRCLQRYPSPTHAHTKNSQNKTLPGRDPDLVKHCQHAHSTHNTYPHYNRQVAILTLYNIVNKRLPGWQVRCSLLWHALT